MEMFTHRFGFYTPSIRAPFSSLASGPPHASPPQIAANPQFLSSSAQEAEIDLQDYEAMDANADNQDDELFSDALIAEMEADMYGLQFNNAMRGVSFSSSQLDKKDFGSCVVLKSEKPSTVQQRVVAFH